LLNFGVAFIVTAFTPPPPQEIQDMVESIRLPDNADDDDETPPPVLH
jgi:cation/acetate symporter